MPNDTVRQGWGRVSCVLRLGLPLQGNRVSRLSCRRPLIKLVDLRVQQLGQLPAHKFAGQPL